MTIETKTCTLTIEEIDKIATLRNDLTLWVIGKLPLTHAQVADYIIALDEVLQDCEL